MNFSRSFFVLTMTCLALTGCGDVRESLGLGRSPPDEFAVVERSPLAMPPDFGLRPPVPGAPRPQDVDPSVHANSALFEGQSKPAGSSTPLSAGEQALLAKIGADKASPNIRSTINSESMSVVDASPHLVDDLLLWKKDVAPGTVVDAAGEAARIKEAKDKGEPLNAGATPVIEKEKSSWLGL